MSFKDLMTYKRILIRHVCASVISWWTEEVSNNFSVSSHITHISMAISANLGPDTDHNSTMLVCDHPLHGRGPYHPLWDRSINPPPTGRVRAPPEIQNKMWRIFLQESIYRKYPPSKKCSEGSSVFEIRNRMSAATPAQPYDGHVETKLDAGCGWSG